MRRLRIRLPIIAVGAQDGGGERIERVFDDAINRRGNAAAVVVAYSDRVATAEHEIATISGLLPLARSFAPPDRRSAAAGPGAGNPADRAFS